MQPERHAVNTLAGLRRRRGEILALAQRHGARNIRVFGSVARAEAGPDSDVDLLAEFEPGRSLYDLLEFKLDLEELLGRPVDVGTPASLKERIRARVLAEAVEL